MERSVCYYTVELKSVVYCACLQLTTVCLRGLGPFYIVTYLQIGSRLLGNTVYVSERRRDKHNKKVKEWADQNE